MSESKNTASGEMRHETFYSKGGQAGDTFNFSLNVDELGYPPKLGDGSYGMVFDAIGDAGNPGYALKVMYSHGSLTTEERERILDELRIGVELPKTLNDVLEEDDVKAMPDYQKFETIARNPKTRLVLPLAYSENFKLHIKPQRTQEASPSSSDAQFTPYAYLMEKFKYSLKDLVEGATPPVRDSDSGNQSTSNKLDVASRPGYRRLKEAKVIERERSAIPVLRHVAAGLQLLYAAGYRHEDIKPANVFYKQDGVDAIFRLGDLGFLRPRAADGGTTIVASPNSFGVGTRHYRSMEQIDFVDVAECDLQADKDTEGRASLVTRDPKFIDTNIEVGDVGYLAKSSTRRRFLIDEMKKDEVTGVTNINISLTKSPESNENEDGSFFRNDNNTQVFFVKRTTAKTDLFGLSAILFDIVTAGHSAERFYEKLRRLDTKGASVEDIMSKYETWKAGIVDDAEIGTIFVAVNGGEGRGDTVSADILRFILQSMMANARDSLFRHCEFAKHVDQEQNWRVRDLQAWSKVLREVDRLETRLEAVGYDRVDTNVLTKPELGEQTSPPPVERAPASEIIEKLRPGLIGANTQIDKGDRVRWVMGVELIRRITLALQREIDKRQDQIFSLAPAHLDVQPDGVVLARPPLNLDNKCVVAKLRTGDPLLTRIRPFAYRYDPVSWLHGTRRVHVHFDDEGEVRKVRGAWPARITYIDFDPLARALRCGDFIVPGDVGARFVLEIDRIDEQRKRLVLKLCSDGGSTTGSWSPSSFSGNAIAKPHPVDYYAGMLAVYLFHLFISDGADHWNQIVDFPIGVYAALKRFPVSFDTYPSRPKKWSSKKRLSVLFEHTARLLIWLSLGGYHAASDRWNKAKVIEEWNEVVKEIEAWKEKMLETLAPGVRSTMVNAWDIQDQELYKDRIGDADKKDRNDVKQTDLESIVASYLGS